jgi:hypothetical protein
MARGSPPRAGFSRAPPQRVSPVKRSLSQRPAPKRNAYGCFRAATAGYDQLVATALHIYLQDHLAGATFGLQLVQRCQRNNEGSELAEPLARLTAEIAEDRRTLQAIMRDVGAEASRTKVAAGWTLEKVRRLKPNGRFFEYTPLARVVELESLAIGIAGKKAMWRALEDVASQEQRLARHDFPALAQRADEQLARVEVLRLDAARTAFVKMRTAEPRARASI